MTEAVIQKVRTVVSTVSMPTFVSIRSRWEI